MKAIKIQIFVFVFLTQLLSARIDALQSMHRIVVVKCDIVDDEKTMTINVSGNSSIVSKTILIRNVLFSNIESGEFERVVPVKNFKTESFFSAINYEGSTIIPDLSISDAGWELTSGKHCLVLMFSPLPVKDVPFIVLAGISEREYKAFMEKKLEE